MSDSELVPTLAKSPEGEAVRERSFALTITSGPDKGRRYAIDVNAPRVLLGQSESCAIRIGDREVSRRHAAIEHAGNALRIVDLGSTNGTRVDRVRIVEALLTGGEILRVGSTTLRVDEVESSVRPPSYEGSEGFGRLVGASLAMRRLYPLLERLAQASVSVILEGETGTGKEILAEVLHERGPRASGPFVIFDCTAVPPTLVESELFGHERGAFTGAVARRRGVFEQARGGTLFIDEIGDLDASLQPKLLRAIERSQIRRLGGESWIDVDVRILCATRRDLDREVEQGRFREDLFHRLAVARVELPPLRRRTGDVRVLARHFWTRIGGDPNALSDDVLDAWERTPWPGNVRELRNTVARHLTLGDLDQSTATHEREDVPKDAEALVNEIVSCKMPFPRARARVLATFTAHYVARMLEEHEGDVAAAAAASGIGRRYFEKLRARQNDEA